MVWLHSYVSSVAQLQHSIVPAQAYHNMSLVSTIPGGPGFIHTTGLLFHFNNAYGSYPGTGTAVTDQSAAANNATLGSAVTYSTENGGRFILAGAANNFISLNNTNFSAASGNASATTMCVWVRTSAVNGAKLIGVQNTIPPTAATSFSNHMWIGTNGTLYGGTFGAAAVINTGTTVNNGAWHYCCYVRSTGASSTQLYVDGATSGAATSPTAQNELIATARVVIGAGTTNATWTNSFAGLAYLNCSIGAVQVYNVALTAAQITQNFNAQRGRYGI